jgi:hypothetical protein
LAYELHIRFLRRRAEAANDENENEKKIDVFCIQGKKMISRTASILPESTYISMEHVGRRMSNVCRKTIPEDES